jgi:hypothetical protein
VVAYTGAEVMQIPPTKTPTPIMPGVTSLIPDKMLAVLLVSSKWTPKDALGHSSKAHGSSYMTILRSNTVNPAFFTDQTISLHPATRPSGRINDMGKTTADEDSRRSVDLSIAKGECRSFPCHKVHSSAVESAMAQPNRVTKDG